MSKIADYCGVVLLLRQLVEAGNCTKKEATRTAAQFATNPDNTAAFTLDVYGHVSDRMREESSARMQAYLTAL